MNTDKKQHNPKQKQREKRNYIFCTYHENTRLNKKMSRPCKICTLHWIPDRPDDHSCSRSWLRYNVFFLQSKKKDGDADISETDLVSDNINPLHGKLISLQFFLLFFLFFYLFIYFLFHLLFQSTTITTITIIITKHTCTNLLHT